jgi:MOSC domain-containing protein YiiM
MIHLTVMIESPQPTVSTLAELEAALADIRNAPPDAGTLIGIARRCLSSRLAFGPSPSASPPFGGEREVLDVAELDVARGLIGDEWETRPSRGGPPDPERQVTVMNARVIRAIAGERWPLAGDQLYVDLALDAERLPAGSRLVIGAATIEITPTPHTGCAKFTARFGSDASRWVNSVAGRALRLRGVNARVVVGGVVRVGDAVRVDRTGR